MLSSLNFINMILKNRKVDAFSDLLQIIPIADIKVIEETLNRIGVANKKEHILYPSCYLWKIDDDFYLMHFKQLFYITRNGGYNNISQEDLLRRNAIAFCLKNWKLIDVDEAKIKNKDSFVFVLPFTEKKNWKIQHKFNVNSTYNHQIIYENSR